MSLERMTPPADPENPAPASPAPWASPSDVPGVETLSGAQRLHGYADLSKIRVNLLVLFVVAVGYFLGSEASVDLARLAGCLVPVALLASGASALNQYLERETDALMIRTQNRPLPLARLRPFEALAFGLTAGILGMLGLALLAGPLAGILGAGTFLSYVLVYTPLKRRSPHALFIGAVPGALPPLIGWAAASGELSLDAWAVFLILFVWQIPHFLAIAWLYRRDYNQAGIPTFPGLDREGASTASLMLWTSALLVICAFVPVFTGERSTLYLVGSTLLGVLCLVPVLRFGLDVAGEDRGRASARRVVQFSIVYVPLLFLLLVLDKLVD